MEKSPLTILVTLSARLRMNLMNLLTFVIKYAIIVIGWTSGECHLTIIMLTF